LFFLPTDYCCCLSLCVEICAVSKVSKKEIGRVFKLILKNLETSVELITTGDFMVHTKLVVVLVVVVVVV